MVDFPRCIDRERRRVKRKRDNINIHRNNPIQLKPFWGWKQAFSEHSVFEVGLSIFVGILFGSLIVFSPYLPISSDFQKLILVIPIAFTAVILFNNLERLILFTIAIGIPLNLDISIIISPYARNLENIARAGYRTLITLTELRLSLITIVLIIGYFVWFLKPRQTWKPTHFFKATTLPAIGLIFISILSVIQAQDKQLWMFRVLQLVEVFLFYFYLANHIRTTQDMKFFIVVSLMGIVAESMLIILQWFTGLDFNILGLDANVIGPNRAAGTLGTTGPAAGYMSVLAFIACAMIWGLPRGPQKYLAIISLIFGTIALIATGSRIGWIGFAITMFAFLLIGMRSGRIKQETLLLLVIAVLIIGIGFSSVIYERLSTFDDNSAQSRFMMWRLAWNVIKAHPWLGVGAGNYALVSRDYYTPDVGIPAEVFDKLVHNAFLGVWAESGTLAMLCYVSILGAAIIKAWSCTKSRSPFISVLGIGIALGIVSLCIQMFTDTFHMRSITLLVWALVALATSLPTIERVYIDTTSFSEKNADYG